MTTTTITRKPRTGWVDAPAPTSERAVMYHMGLLARRITLRRLTVCEDYRCSCRGTEHDAKTVLVLR